ncbi:MULTISPECIES: DUF5994 family protein [unclassified Nonomuraea]|uniref:DUF5994 family protein n=1 Tax=Nonomuraea sp. NPDC047529 TaxID=3155623 RepID=UPI0033CBDE2D
MPHRIAAPGRQVREGWFRAIDPHLINLIIPGIEPINLLVIPPAAPEKALALVTRCRGRARSGDVLTAADHDGPTDTAAEEEQRLAGWDNEGGRTPRPAREDPTL